MKSLNQKASFSWAIGTIQSDLKHSYLCCFYTKSMVLYLKIKGFMEGKKLENSNKLKTTRSFIVLFTLIWFGETVFYSELAFTQALKNSPCMVKDPDDCNFNEDSIILSYPDTEDWEQAAKKFSLKNAVVVSQSYLGETSHAAQIVKQGRWANIAVITSFDLAKEIESFSLLHLPFLITNLSDAHHILNKVGEDLNQEAMKQGLYVLGYTWHSNAFVSQRKTSMTLGGGIKCPEPAGDFQNRSFFTPYPFYNEFLYRQWSAEVVISNEPGNVFDLLPVPLALIETALIPTSRIIREKEGANWNCFFDPRDNVPAFLPHVIFTSKDWWFSLDPEKQKDIKCGLENVKQNVYSILNQHEKELIRFFDRIYAFKEIIEIDEDTFKQWRKEAQPYYRSFVSDIDGGQELLSKVLESLPKN